MQNSGVIERIYGVEMVGLYASQMPLIMLRAEAACTAALCGIIEGVSQAVTKQTLIEATRNQEQSTGPVGHADDTLATWPCD